MDSYWAGLLRNRISRRRALGATAGVAASAAFLVACGSDDTEGGSTGGGLSTGGSTQSPSGGTGGTAPSMVMPLEDETDSVKRGGTYTAHTGTLGPNLDPRMTGAQQCYLSYSRLLHVQEGHLQNSSGELSGDIADSWEFSPDYTTLALRITDQAHFSPIAPVNGRAVDVEDVLYSWETFKDIGSRRSELVNEVNPDAPILSVSQTDERTIVVKLKGPDVTVLPRLAEYQNGSWLIVPKEAAEPNVLDLRNTQAGSGPWNLIDYQPSASAVYKRNPGFHQDPRDVPYMDELHYAILGEYSSFLANFKAGNLLHGQAILAQDLIPMKRDVPELEMRSRPLATTSPRAFFGRTEDNPFLDDRIRTAWVMCINRDLFLDTFYNIENLRQEGLPMEAFWDTSLAANVYEGWWLDPQSEEFGDSAKFYSGNVSEASKLLAAAGYPDGIDYKAYWPTEFGDSFYERVEAIVGMASEAGFRPERVLLDWATEYNADFRYNRGMFDGVAMALDPPINDPTASLFSHYHTNGALYYSGDSHVDEILEKMLVEFDAEERMTLAHEFQRYEASKQYKPRIGSVTVFGLNWPAVRNQGVWQGDYLREFATIYLDPALPPLA